MNGVHALVLAAGAGSRFGGGKLMAPWRDGVLLDGALAAAAASGVDTVRVVVGGDPRVAPYVVSRGFECVVACDAGQGLSASLKAGVLSLPESASGVLVFLGDMPLISQEVAKRLLDHLMAGSQAAVPVFEGSLGHPVGFAASLFHELKTLQGDQGGRAILSGLGDAIALINSPDGSILFDVDYRTDLPH